MPRIEFTSAPWGDEENLTCVDHEWAAAFDRRNTLADGIDGGMPVQPPYGLVPSLATLHANPHASALRRARIFEDAGIVVSGRMDERGDFPGHYTEEEAAEDCESARRYAMRSVR